MTAALLFLQRWSPYIWLFGSVLGVLMSGTLANRAMRSLIKLEGKDDPELLRTLRYWRRHSMWFLGMHTGFVLVGITAVAHVTAPWAQFLSLGVLLGVPLVLVYRSYDSLRFGGHP